MLPICVRYIRTGSSIRLDELSWIAWAISFWSCCSSSSEGSSSPFLSRSSPEALAQLAAWERSPPATLMARTGLVSPMGVATCSASAAFRESRQDRARYSISSISSTPS